MAEAHRIKIEEIMEQQNAILAGVLERLGGSLTPSSHTMVQANVRSGKIGLYFQPGDPYPVAKETGVSVTVSGEISATVDEDVFVAAIGHSGTAAYEFEYDGAAWRHSGEIVELGSFGVTATGTPVKDDMIIVHVQGNVVVCEVAGINCDVPVNPNLKNSMTLITRDIVTYNTIARCASQALASVQSEIAAGTTVYVVADHSCYDATTKQDGSYGFVAPIAIPAGAKLKHTTLGAYQASAADYTQGKILAGTWNIFDKDYNLLQEGIETIETSTGTYLGTVTCSNPQYLVNGAAHVNFTQRNAYGSNRAAHAAHKKFMESDAAGAASGAIASWWTPSDEFDMPVRSTLPGFLHGIDPEFRSILAKVWKRTALSIADGYGYEDTQELVFAPSMTEMGFGNNNSIVETSPKGKDGDPNWAGAYPLYDGAVNADRIKYQGATARYWFMRSPYPSYASYVRIVFTSGSLYNYDSASNAYGVVAGLTIA